MVTELQGAHRRTFDAIFQHPVARNLAWRDVCAMLDAMTDVVQEQRDDQLKISRNGRMVILHRPQRKNISDVQDLMDLRHFLEQSSAPVLPIAKAGLHLLVSIDHRLARIYKTEFHGSQPQRVIPYDHNGTGRHLHNVADDSNGQRKPELKSFYEAVADTLKGAEEILIFGNGTGASSAMDQLVSVLKAHHKDLAERIIGTVVVDEQHLTEDQLLAKARGIYESRATSQSSAIKPN